MTLWRGTTSPEVQEDMDQVYEGALHMVQWLLGKDGKFIPCAIQLRIDGERRIAAAKTHAASGDAIPEYMDVLYGGMQSEAKDLQCVAVLADAWIRAPEPSDAIKLHVEHRDGPSVGILIPYTVKQRHSDWEVELGGIHAAEEKRRIWHLDRT